VLQKNVVFPLEEEKEWIFPWGSNGERRALKRSRAPEEEKEERRGGWKFRQRRGFKERRSQHLLFLPLLAPAAGETGETNEREKHSRREEIYLC